MLNDQIKQEVEGGGGNKGKKDSDRVTHWYNTVGLSKSAQEAIQDVEKMNLSEGDQAEEVKNIVHGDLEARKAMRQRLGYALDVLIVGGAVVVVVGVFQVVVWTIGKLLPMSAALPAAGGATDEMVKETLETLTQAA